MGFSNLPSDVIYEIAHSFDSENHINALTRTNKFTYSVLNRYLYRHHVSHWYAGAPGFKFACKRGLSTSMRMFLDAGMPPASPTPMFCDEGMSEALLRPRTGDQIYDIDWTPLSLAAMYGLEEVVRYLLERGVDPNARQARDAKFLTKFLTGVVDTWGGPFDLAIRNGHEGVVRLLVPHMRCVDYVETRTVTGKVVSDGRTPLTLAAQNGYLNLVKMLVEELKCSVEPTRSQKARGKITWKEKSPMGHAANMGHTDVVRYLISVGADVNAIFKESWETAFGYAVLGNHLETAKVLIEHGFNPDPFLWIQKARTFFRPDKNKAKKDAYKKAYEGIIQPLIHAGAYGHQEVVKLVFHHIDLDRILKYGVEDVNVEDINFLVPIAAACGLDGIVQRLLEEGGCDVDASLTVHMPEQQHAEFDQPLNMCTALTLASKYGHISVVRVLLSHGADPNAKVRQAQIRANEFTTTKPLVAAVKAGHQGVTELLLDSKADPNTAYERDLYNYYYTPLLKLAVQSEPMFNMLLSRGADLFALDYYTRCILFDKFMDARDTIILRALLESQQFDLSVIENHPRLKDYIQKATRKGCNFSSYFRFQYGLTDDPREENEPQRALHLAIRRQHADVVEPLIQHYGLRLDSGVWSMADLLALAAGVSDLAKAEKMLDILFRYGADINATRGKYDSHTCLSVLIGNNNLQGAKLAIKHGAKYPMNCIVNAGYPLCAVANIECVGMLELLLGLIEAQGIPSEAIEPHLRQAEVKMPKYRIDHWRLKLIRPLQDFRWRRRYPVPQ